MVSGALLRHSSGEVETNGQMAGWSSFRVGTWFLSDALSLAKLLCNTPNARLGGASMPWLSNELSSMVRLLKAEVQRDT